jgi:hypothetical protein
MNTSSIGKNTTNTDTDGPTNDDIGNYTKISYYRIATNYKWRTPYEEDRAAYNEGYKSDKTDDAASITYGEKEIWLVSKIEGRNQVACFYISPRKDGYGAKGINGGLGSDQKSYKLDTIVLYDKSSGKKIKTVHFEYNYILCKGTSNSNATDNGKLTLKKIYFTYGESDKGKFNAYQFDYKDKIGTTDIRYFTKAYDRWGNYKPDIGNNDLIITGCDEIDESTSNFEYPYVNQNKNLADQYTAAWCLTNITLPSGGKISIEYESDDYAYVQNKRAMQMFKIKGFGSSVSDNSSVSQDRKLLYTDNGVNDFIFFNLPDAIKSWNNEKFKTYVLEGSNNVLYYNCLVNLTNLEQNMEYIRGYTTIVDAGITNDRLGKSRKTG